MQLHPRDTGGAIFEIDQNVGFDQPDGPWWPAGDNWLPSKRTDVVSHFLGVELQSDDPVKLAQRWSEIDDHSGLTEHRIPSKEFIVDDK